MKRVCIHQPDFLPYLGFFHRLLLVDQFIVLDDVQFEKGGWHHRDQVKTRQGTKWLTLSIKKGYFLQQIRNVQLSQPSQSWVDRNLNLIQENYKNSSYFDAYFSQIQDIYRQDHEKLIDINLAFLEFCLQVFEIEVEIIFSSSLQVEGTSNQRLINLLKAVDGTHYLSGIGARDYMEEEMFIEAGIQVEWQQFNHPIYPQLHGDFIPYLSCIDLFFNCGPKSKEILHSCLNED